MRKGLSLLFGAILLFSAYGLAQAAITGSLHDFTSGGTGDTAVDWQGGGTQNSNEVCAACHVPHSSLGPSGRFQQALLWRQTIRAYPVASTWWATADYWYSSWRTEGYSWIPINGTRDLDAGSRRCLGCHEGKTFYLWDTRAGANSTELTASITNSAKIVSTLTNVHPVGVLYETSGGVGGSVDFDTQANAEADGIRFVKTDGKPAGSSDDAYVGCGSCHDPHNGTATNGKFLRAAIDNSTLCLACHKK